MKKTDESKYYAGAMYEWWLALKQLGGAHEQCSHCTEAAKKLEKCIGEKEVKLLKRLVRQHPYSLPAPKRKR